GEARIVGGGETTIEQWPWQVSLGLNPAYDQYSGAQSQFDRHFCGGTLVAPEIVVSAAHCLFDSFFEGAWMDPQDFQIISGRSRLSGSDGQVLGVAGYAWFTDDQGYQLYDPAYYGNSQFDLVLIELASPASSKPIKIAGPGEEALWRPGREAFISGWGSTSEGGPGSDVLKSNRVEMLDDSTCASGYGSLWVGAVMACAGDLAGGNDSCQGDSGGPLVVPIDGGGHRLVGDTSFGEGCARAGVPGVYGRLAADPLRAGIAEAASAWVGADVLGSGALPPGCTPLKAALNEARAKAAKAQRALRKATRSGSRGAVKRAKRGLKNAKAGAKRAQTAFGRECA
ncbi:MAG: serine protease, partial [Solirubrobacterales bacterium]